MVDNRRLFAQIDELSYYDDEAEILFTVDSIFRLKDISEDESLFRCENMIHVPAEHPDLSASYNNIGSIHYYVDHYDLALKYYDRSVKIKLKTLPT
ncbi:unnamed protein product [Rotaria magnacalcarata]|uniref:Tetratricopeptide repeat protein n=1 Tax=Rotaria magnacalcarata TaxID=392030 RepID=A0A819D6S5_9BILA|nr:unnamed protein product [Rotaria magnacalcarata]CAF4134702.1 unnamed protein product [Rotaria magnacalcarata]